MADENEGNKGATEPTGGSPTSEPTGENPTTGGEQAQEPLLDTKSINSRLDGIEDMIQRLRGSLQKVSDAQAVLVQSGAVIDTNENQKSVL